VALATCRAAGRKTFDPRRFGQIAAVSMVPVPAERAQRIAGLEAVKFNASGTSPEVQTWLNQGIGLAYGFNHYEAIKAFREGQRLDPNCSLCFWGEAWALGFNINAPMDPAALEPARAAAANALRLAKNPRERVLAEAVVARYSGEAGAAAGEAAHAEKMRAAYQQFPGDDDVAAVFAESLANLQPWDYWEADGRSQKGGIGEALSTVETVLARNPDHVQAIHLYIHLTEASVHAGKATPYADRLGTLMPGSGHLVHMPGHIYYRIGRFKDSLSVNIAAMAVDEAYLTNSDVSATYAGGYYPHNVHFALTSAQMAGDRDNVLRAATLLPKTLIPELVAAVGWVQALAAGPYFAHAQFSDPATIMSLPDADVRFPFLQGARAYARAIAATASGDLTAARAEAERLAALARHKDIDRLTNELFMPADTILKIAQAVIEGRIAQSLGEHATAVAAFEKAVGLEDSLPYMEPPYWYYPTRQSLGAALVMAGRPADAVPVFEAALVASPNNGWVLFGLAKAREALGDQAGEKAARGALERAWVGDPALLDLRRL
jgi:tetratricopeptide (TPR) repeat protein